MGSQIRAGSEFAATESPGFVLPMYWKFSHVTHTTPGRLGPPIAECDYGESRSGLDHKLPAETSAVNCEIGQNAAGARNRGAYPFMTARILVNQARGIWCDSSTAE